MQDLQSDSATLFDVLRFVHLAHAAAPKKAFDAIRAERLTGREVRLFLRRVARRDIC
jgi:hypothetical protein